jgi:hypothetical protein
MYRTTTKRLLGAGIIPIWLLLFAATALAQGGAEGSDEDGGWLIKRAPQTDLWFHALAVVQADQPGPLGLYSADYARRIREAKQQLGVYPTVLDSLAPDFRTAFDRDSSLTTMHFVPLYFPRATAERMLGALRAVAKRKTEDSSAVGRDVRLGVAVLSRAFQKGSQRRLLESLVNAIENEWSVFFHDYWAQQAADEDARYEDIQAMWDTVLVPYLEPFLERRRLSAGIVMPSPALGPEGRITDFDEFDPSDQVVAVQLPETSDTPEAAVYAFLKELCFLIIDNGVVGLPSEGENLEDLRRTAAVRCGALILDFYAPTEVASYRRVFLDAVGAEESGTVNAFERVYALEPARWERLREQVRRR